MMNTSYHIGGDSIDFHVFIRILGFNPMSLHKNKRLKICRWGCMCAQELTKTYTVQLRQCEMLEDKLVDQTDVRLCSQLCSQPSDAPARNTAGLIFLLRVVLAAEVLVGKNA